MKKLNTLSLHLSNNSYLKDTAVLTLGTLISQIIAFLALPFLSRIYDPSAFGLVAVFVSVVSVVTVSATLRYDVLISIQKSEEEATRMLALSLLLAVLVGCSAAITAATLPRELWDLIRLGSVAKWMPLAIITGGLAAGFSSIIGWLNYRRRYVIMGGLRAAQGVSSVLLALSLGLSGWKSGLIWSQILAWVIAIFIALFFLPSVIKCLDKKSLVKTATNNIATPKYLLPTAFLDTMTTQLPVLLISTWFGNYEAGQFSMAWRILAIPVVLIGSSVGQVFTQKFAQVWPDSRKGLRLVLKTWLVLGAIILPITLLFAFMGDKIFEYVLGGDWQQAGRMAMSLSVLMFFMFVSSPTSATYIVMGLYSVNFWFGISSLIVRPASLWFGTLKGDIWSAVNLFVIVEVFQIMVYQAIAIRTMRVEYRQKRSNSPTPLL
jgi:O-antigen/teichoic acid export membrane protein